MKKLLVAGAVLFSTLSFAVEGNKPKYPDIPGRVTIKGQPSMPAGVMGYVQFTTVEGHVLHIGPSGYCLYEQGQWQRWCK